MPFRLPYHPLAVGNYMSVRDIAVTFSRDSRTVERWIRKASDGRKTLRVCYHPNRSRKCPVLSPSLYVHVEDVIAIARTMGVVISKEFETELLKRWSPR